MFRLFLLVVVGVSSCAGAICDQFNRPDANTLGPNCTVVNGGAQISSNQTAAARAAGPPSAKRGSFWSCFEAPIWSPQAASMASLPPLSASGAMPSWLVALRHSRSGACGVRLRHDDGSQFMSDDFQTAPRGARLHDAGGAGRGARRLSPALQRPLAAGEAPVSIPAAGSSEAPCPGGCCMMIIKKTVQEIGCGVGRIYAALVCQ